MKISLTNKDIDNNYRDKMFYMSSSDIVGSFAYYIYIQSPIGIINLDKPIKAIKKYIDYCFKGKEDYLKFDDSKSYFASFTYNELKELIYNNKEIDQIPEVHDLNKTKPDFIDLDALRRNVFFMVCREEIINN